MKGNVLRNHSQAKSGMNSSFTLGKKKTSKLKAKGGGGGGRLAGRRSPSVCGTQIWGLDVYKARHQPPRETPEQKRCASSPGPQVRVGPL